MMTLRSYGFYDFESLKEEFGDRISLSLKMHTDKTQSLEEIDNMVIKYDRDNLGVRKEVDVTHRNFKVDQINQEERVSEETAMGYQKCFKGMKNLKLTCWECEEARQQLIQIVLQDLLISYPDWNQTFILQTDAGEK
eukprot:Nk52_evm1s1660 gene=Nk52_evmTU1s1660